MKKWLERAKQKILVINLHVGGVFGDVQRYFQINLNLKARNPFSKNNKISGKSFVETPI